MRVRLSTFAHPRASRQAAHAGPVTRPALSITLALLSGFASAQSPFQPPAAQVPEPAPRAVAVVPDGMTADRAIIGEDDRVRPMDTTAWPYRAIGRILLKTSKGEAACTGTLIGPRHVLTAAHCIHSEDTGGAITGAFFVPGKDGDHEPYGRFSATRALFPRAYLENAYLENSAGNFADLAVLILDTPIGDRLGYFGYAPWEPGDAALDEELEQLSALAAAVERKEIDRELAHKRYTEWMRNAPERFPEETLRYFGYSGDLGGNVPWGDRCVVFGAQGRGSVEFPQVRQACDSNPGASGSAFFDDHFVVRSVLSYSNAKGDVEVMRDGDGRSVGRRGSAVDVTNINSAISPTAVALIDGWKSGKTSSKSTVVVDLQPSVSRPLTVSNACSETLYFAVHWHPGGGDWETEGYFLIQRGGTLEVKSVSDHVMVLGRTETGRTWGGDTTLDVNGESWGFGRIDLQPGANRYTFCGP